MSKKYLVDEKTLLRLVKSREVLMALDYGGVSNWGYCHKSLGDYLKFKEYDDFKKLAKDIVNEEYELFLEE